MRNEKFRQEQHQCPHCKEILTYDYLEQNPFPEIPCFSCGSLMEISSDIEEEFVSQNMRQEERCDIALKVTYKSFNRFIIDYTKNVNKGGMFIKTKSSHEIGSRLDVLLHVPGLDGPIRIMGRVIHNSIHSDNDEDAGIGMDFIDIDEISREILIAHIKTLKGCN